MTVLTITVFVAGVMLVALVWELLEEAMKGNSTLMTIEESLRDFKTQAMAALESTGAALDQATQAITNIAADEASLTRKIDALQAQISTGALTADQQAELTDVLRTASAMSAKTQAAAEALAQVAAAVPDVQPPLEPVVEPHQAPPASGDDTGQALQS